jgi:hypothetical protein
MVGEGGTGRSKVVMAMAMVSSVPAQLRPDAEYSPETGDCAAPV